MRTSTATVSVTGTDWQAVADELAGALQETMQRNPRLTARAWDRARAALGQYERAGRGAIDESTEPAPVTPEA